MFAVRAYLWTSWWWLCLFWLNLQLDVWWEGVSSIDCLNLSQARAICGYKPRNATMVDAKHLWGKFTEKPLASQWMTEKQMFCQTLIPYKAYMKDKEIWLKLKVRFFLSILNNSLSNTIRAYTALKWLRLPQGKTRCWLTHTVVDILNFLCKQRKK